MAVVNDSGLIVAKEPGVTIVTGRVELSDPSHGGRMVTYTEDFVTVTVVRMTGVRIHLPDMSLLSDVTVAVYAVGINNESPFTFVAAVPGLTFQWSVDNMDAFSLTSVYDKAGVSLQEEQDFHASLHTWNPGQGALRLRVKCPPKVCIPDEASFTDQVRVQVLAPLRLLRPLNGHFLLPHNGHARIVTNRDGVSMLSYQILNGYGGCSSGEEAGLIMLDKLGGVTSAAVNGHAVVMVTENEETIGLNQTLMVHVEVSTWKAMCVGGCLPSNILCAPMVAIVVSINHSHLILPLTASATHRNAVCE